MDPRRAVDSAYQRIGPDFDKHRSTPWKFVVDWLKLDLADAAEQRELLVAGCGHGRHVRVAMELGFSVTGIDSNVRMIEAAQAASVDTGDSSPKLLVADVCDLPFEADSFHSVICIAVLHHLPFDLHLRAIEELSRVLRSGGEMLISCWDPSAPSVAKGEVDAEDPDVRWVPWQLPDGEVVMRYYHLPDLELRMEHCSRILGLESLGAELLDQNQVMRWRAR